MRNLGFTQQNPYGLVLLTSAKVDNVAFAFPTPLPTTGAAPAPTERPPAPDRFQTAKSTPSPSDQAFSIATPR